MAHQLLDAPVKDDVVLPATESNAIWDEAASTQLNDMLLQWQMVSDGLRDLLQRDNLTDPRITSLFRQAASLATIIGVVVLSARSVHANVKEAVEAKR